MNVHASKVQDIPLSKITISPLHFERKHDEDELEKLVEDLGQTGLIHPLSVRKSGKVFELLAGERRLRALKMAGAKTVRCIVHACDDAMAELLSIKENVLGTEPLTPAEMKRAIDRVVELNLQAKGRQDTVDESRVTKAKSRTRSGNEPGEQEAREEAARQLNISESTVQKFRGMKKLTPAALRAFNRSQITLAQAEKLASMTPREQGDALPKMLRETNRETTNRESLEKLGGKDSNYKASIKCFNMIVQECEVLTSKATPLVKTMSPEAAQDVEKDALDVVKVAIDALQQLCAHIEMSAEWAEVASDD
jgi:ParB/RepB/Spo0J family partition protein